ncbi:MAG TPA: alpha/beta hydrolase [Acidimicrobiales bacterium]|jgi:pimeloyl-ACP methyl ester carboxylesterase
MDVASIDLPTGVSLEYAEAGRGGRPFLLVHGFTGAKEDFTEWLERLASLGWHAVAIDNRGHGASVKPESKDEYSLSLLADDTLAFADALWGAEAHFVLLGHSMGGMVAQVVAMRDGDRLDGLVLMDTGHGPLSFIEREQALTVVSIVEDRGIDGLADLLADREAPLDSPAHQRVLRERDGYAEFNDRKLRSTATAAYAALLMAMVDADDRLDGLRAISVPTFVIVGEQDRPLLGQSRNMAEAIPGAELAVIADAGHSPQFENPDGWWGALSGFLASVAEGSAAR